MPDAPSSRRTAGSHEELRKLRAETKTVTISFWVFLTVSVGLVWFYAHFGPEALLRVSSGRFGHGIDSSLSVIAIPFVATILLGIDLVRLRRRLRKIAQAGK